MCHWALDSTIRGIAAFGYHNLQCLKCGNQTVLVMCVFKCVSCHLCALCSWGGEWRFLGFFSGPYICLYQYLGDILFRLHDSSNERLCGAAVICAIFVYILCFWCAFPTRYPLSCLIYFIQYIIYSCTHTRCTFARRISKGVT